jgi:hypothetical protein
MLSSLPYLQSFGLIRPYSRLPAKSPSQKITEKHFPDPAKVQRCTSPNFAKSAED